ncbi:EAL domain-containing protein [Vibrio mediterranei]|uniref:EAL domain-containing protein n=1 Tax=Vibrio mediterranei TaxID=689 RepID=UPI0012EA324B|nr:EAL domain-containing protein [Vibrio mediterranei]
MNNNNRSVTTDSLSKQGRPLSSFDLRYVSLFFLYIVSSFLFSMLSPQTLVASLWPSAGIALAGCFLWQRHFLPAILAGSLIFSIGIQLFDGNAIDLSLIVTSIGISFASTVQAWINYRVLRHLSLNVISLASFTKVTLFIGVAFICSLIGSLIANLLIEPAHILRFSGSYWANVVIQCVGDFLGIIIITPIVVILFKSRDRLANRLKHSRALIFPLSIVFITLIIIQNYSDRTLKSDSLNEVQVRSQLIEKNLNHQVENYLKSLSTLARSLSGNGDITQEEFREITLPLIDKTPGIRGFSWNPLVEQRHVSKFEIETNNQSSSMFKVRGIPLNEYDPLVVVKWIEPFHSNEKAFGFNVFSNAARREAMILAQNNNYPVATEIIQLVQLETKEPGFLIFTPINDGPSLDTSVITRSFNLSGFAVGVFVVGDIVKASVNNSSAHYMDVEILDSSAGDEVIYHYFSPDNLAPSEGAVEFSFSQQVTTREWTVVLSVSQQVLLSLTAQKSVTFLIYESVFGALSVLLIMTVFNNHKVLLRRVKSRTKELEASRDQLKHYAFNDALTNLPNRRMFIEQTNHALRLAERNRSITAVLFLDLNRFKHVNDSLGHDFGDKLLVEVSKRLSGCLRSSDVLARFGGDEFTILIENLTNIEQAIALSKKIINGLRKPIQIGRESLTISTSIGIAAYPKDGQNVDDLLRAADTAMYKAKESSVGYFCYANTLRKQAQHKLFIESELPRALEKGQFELYYQPIIELRSGKHLGCECLLRWNHPTYGVISPDSFIPIAEVSGEIIPIGAWVIEQACKQIRVWQDHNIYHKKVSVNVSVVQLVSGQLIDDVVDPLQRYGISPEALELEITESVLVQNMGQAIRFITELKKIGVNIAIDDYGTGYSSLSYLKQLPVDSLKIDRIFIDQLHPEDMTIVSSTLQMANELGINVIAEGIQTAEQMKILIDHDCQWGQGFLFSKPLPQSSYTAFCQNSKLSRSARSN